MTNLERRLRKLEVCLTDGSGLSTLAGPRCRRPVSHWNRRKHLSTRFLYGETGNDLRLPLVEKLKVFLMCLELLSAEWQPLAEGLRTAGVPAPTDVDWDVPDGPLVGETRP
jgi:hypothetical protein